MRGFVYGYPTDISCILERPGLPGQVESFFLSLRRRLLWKSVWRTMVCPTRCLGVDPPVTLFYV